MTAARARHTCVETSAARLTYRALEYELPICFDRKAPSAHLALYTSADACFSALSRPRSV